MEPPRYDDDDKTLLYFVIAAIMLIGFVYSYYEWGYWFFPA